jgi:catechol 2,3-dioxygenase-like lactoylglutathione lyase family enzyme
MTKSQTKAKFQHINPQFLVTDLEIAVAFYRDKLGFEVEFAVGEPVVFAAMLRSGIIIYLRQVEQREPSRQFKAEGKYYDVYIFTDDVEALYREYIDKGVTIVEPLKMTDYGSTEFLIEDNSGYLIRFGQ